jgi:cob(I)alamin adenosyltransferase
LIESDAAIQEHILPYVNRLSDAIWLFGRLLELEAGVDSKLRDAAHRGARWSRAW